VGTGSAAEQNKAKPPVGAALQIENMALPGRCI